VVSGRGTIDTPAFIASGTVRPALYLGGVVGELTVSGAYTQQATSDLEIDLRGTTPGVSYDRVVVTGVATLNGNLDVTVGGGFAPVVGDVFTVLTAASVSGAFSSSFIAGLAPNTAGVIEYLPTSVRIEILTDTDDDGAADLFDCDPLDPDVFAAPGDVSGFTLLADAVTLTWTSAVPGAGLETVHNVVRGDLRDFPVNAAASLFCLAPGLTGASTTDPEMPANKAGYYYLVGATNSCGEGYGVDGGGTPYTVTVCP
jgi:hypothetical protein